MARAPEGLQRLEMELARATALAVGKGGTRVMHLMYVDESGDCGLSNSPTRHFVLTGLVVHERKWQDTLNALLHFRRRTKARFRLGVRDELHASHFITRPGRRLASIPRHERLMILRSFADCLAGITDLSLITVLVDKSSKSAGEDVFEMAWRALLQRFENTMSHGNFPGPADPQERGMLLPDHTDDKKLTQLVRRMRYWNPVPNRPGFNAPYRNLTIDRIIEDPNFRESAHSYFIQAADLAAYLVYQSIAPNAYIRRKGAQGYYRRLQPIFCTAASRAHPMGFVEL